MNEEGGEECHAEMRSLHLAGCPNDLGGSIGVSQVANRCPCGVASLWHNPLPLGGDRKCIRSSWNAVTESEGVGVIEKCLVPDVVGVDGS